VGVSTAEQRFKFVSRACRFYIDLYARHGRVALSTALVLAKWPCRCRLLGCSSRSLIANMSEIAALALALPATPRC
jgi:hypothetical protein